MPLDTDALIATGRRYLSALEAGATGETLAAFFDPDVLQIELPNRLVPRGARRDLAALLAAAEKGQLVVSDQRYEVKNVVAQDATVVFEVAWSATSKVPLGKLETGARLRADFAVVLVFRDGRIAQQRNYDCFHDL